MNDWKEKLLRYDRPLLLAMGGGTAGFGLMGLARPEWLLWIFSDSGAPVGIFSLCMLLIVLFGLFLAYASLDPVRHSEIVRLCMVEKCAVTLWFALGLAKGFFPVGVLLVIAVDGLSALLLVALYAALSSNSR